MSIKVEWEDVNSNSEEYYVYRATSPILDASLPVPLATVLTGTKFYLDKATARNVLYYYRIGSKVGTDINLSANKPLSYVPYTGPGPQSLIRGNWELGYFGKMGINDLFVPIDLQTQFGLGGMPFTYGGQTQYWLKFAYKGKVFFIASHPLFTSLTWESVYRAGLVYGNLPSADWPAYPKTTFGIIDQARTLTRGQDQFMFHLPASRAVPGSTENTVAALTGGEYDLLISAAYWNTTYNFNPYRLDDVDGAGGSFTQDFSTPGGGATVVRGNATVIDVLTYQQAAGVTATAVGWRPILELIN